MSYQEGEDSQLQQHKNQKREKMVCFNSERRLLSLLDLPTLVLLNILSRLPIKSILNCKCVSKEWYKLLSDPFFVRTYLANLPFVSVLISLDNKVSYLLDVKGDHDYDSYTNKPICLKNKIKLSKNPGKELVVIGSCNGLLCLLKRNCAGDGNYIDDYRLYISNPLFGELVKIPIPNYREEDHNFAYGFGYSKAIDQFKILRIAEIETDNFKYILEAKVYTIGVDHSWRDVVGEAPCPYYGKICGVTLNDTLHWIKDFHSESDIQLFSFDIKEEKIRAVPSPHNMRVKRRFTLDTFYNFDNCKEVELGVLRNYLCIFDNRQQNILDIWWMKEYGIGESWTRDRLKTSPSPGFPIPDTLLSDGDSPEFFIPITMWRDREILMFTEYGKLFSYDPQGKKWTQLKMSNIGQFTHFAAALFVPNFSSLKSLMGEDVQRINMSSES